MNRTDSAYLGRIAIIGTLCVVFTYALCIIPAALISPEICKQYVFLNSTRTFGEALHKFLVFDETWYRPFQFYMTNYIFFHVIDIRNIYAVKALSVTLTLVNGFILTRLSRQLYDSSLPERLIVFALIVTHPAYYCLAYDGSVQTDIFLNSFITLFIIHYLRLLEHTMPALGMRRKEGMNKWRQMALCCIYMLCAVTSNERALAVLPMSWLLYAYFHWRRIKHEGLRPEITTTFVIILSLTLLAVYLVLIFPQKPSLADTNYRTGIEPEQIKWNLLRTFEWPFRFFFASHNPWLDPQHSLLLFNVLAMPFLLVFGRFILHLKKSGEASETGRFTILCICFACSLPIPVLFGGFNWHYYTACMFVSVAVGRAAWLWISALPPYYKTAFLNGLFYWLCIATIVGTQEEIRPAGGLRTAKSIIPQAMQDPVLHSLTIPPDVVYFDTGLFGGFIWLFGGNMYNVEGDMFKYLYDRPDIIEIPIVWGKVRALNADLCDRAKGKRAAYFGIYAYGPSWHTIPEKDYCAESLPAKK